jgi:hypothetical protein
MNNGQRGGISQVAGNPNGSKYVVKANFADKPVNAISWFNAARVANWMQNGADSSASTETGAYTLTGIVGEPDGTLTVARNPGATVWIPSQDEWYKAAYYNGDGTYWRYATESNSLPASVSADSTGVGSSGPVGNTANYAEGADWNTADGNVTSVGTNGASSHYGTYDMSGNVREVIEGTPGVNATFLGGTYSSTSAGLGSLATDPTAPATGNGLISGFRLATITPEPGSTIPLLTLFGLGMAKSRRRKA